MERQTRHGAPEVVQLVVAVEHLVGAVQQPGGVEDDMVEGELRILGSLRLQHLPTELLHSITRATGRPSRLLSTTLHDAYGPLTCGLSLDLSHDYAALQAMLARNPRRFQAIGALALISMRTQHTAQAFLRSLPLTFPSIASLTLDGFQIDECSLLELLAPLGAGLTALDIGLEDADRGDHVAQPVNEPQPPPDLVNPPAEQPPLVNHPQQPVNAPPQPCPPPTLASSLRQFQSLRCLTLRAPLQEVRWDDDGSLLPVTGTLGHLSSLPQLQHFELHSTGDNHFTPAPTWLPSLTRLPLTTLIIKPFTSGWDQLCVDALGGLSLLRSLELNVDFTDTHNDAIGGNTLDPFLLATALVKLAALSCLALSTACMGADFPLAWLAFLPHLSRLSLDMSYNEEDMLTDVLLALCCGMDQQTLTCLRIEHLSGEGAAAVLSNMALAHLGLMPGLLQELSIHVIFQCPHSLCSMLAALTSLTKLGVEMPDVKDAVEEPWWGPSAMCDPQLEEDWPEALAPLSALTGLRALRIRGGSDRLSAATLQLVPCFTQLQALSLFGTWARRDVVCQADLWKLLPLHSTLTCLHVGDFTGVDGPGLAVVGQLTCLMTLGLTVSTMRVVDANVPQYLLPLPPSLCNIDLVIGQDGAGVREQLEAALRANRAAQGLAAYR